MMLPSSSMKFTMTLNVLNATSALWTATDDCGNVESHTQIIYVIDTTPPVIDPFPISVFVECDEVDDLMVTATDDCNEVTITYEDVLFSGGCLGVIARTWIATDACGNVSTAEQYITVTDTTAPEIIGVGEGMDIDCADPIPAIPMVGGHR